MVMSALERLDPPRILGDMTLLATLGEGGMATVYLAGVGDGPLARMCAVKLLRANLPDHDYRTRFLDEARLVVRLHHNNIVDVRTCGEIDDQLYIAMEAIEGRDLADVWDRCAEVGRAFPVPLAVHICREVLRGLHYAHTFPGLGLVHRDVSPSNVLIDWAGAVRVADFGLATSSLKASLTLPGVVFGKVGYMSPEQARHEPLDGRADVYAVAVILWELLTGRPLRSPDGMSTDSVSRFEAPAPSARSRRVDPQLDKIVIKGLARDREDRWPNAETMMLALSQWLADNAPDMGQEKVAEFMRKLFGNAREIESAMRAELLRELVNLHRVSGPTQILEESGRSRVAAQADEPERESRSARSGGVGRPPVEERELIETGTVIADRYRVLSRLGRGGMGYVYLGEHVTVGRSVAIKVLTYDWSRNAAVAQRFRAEARAASAAGHPNIVEVFDAGELSDGRLFLVMEFLTGRNLFEEVQAVGRLPVARACHIMRDVGRAIRAAHEVGIIHRDLKADNVMLVDRGRDEGELVKVLDFGISASAQRNQDEQRLTTVGQALGTPEYMAPEQAKGKETNPLFDIYALGVLFYELLTGDPPFHGLNVLEIIARKTTEPAPSIAKHRDDLPDDLIELIDDCLALDPSKRPQTAQIFLARLEDVLRGLPRASSGANQIAYEASLTHGKRPDKPSRFPGPEAASDEPPTKPISPPSVEPTRPPSETRTQPFVRWPWLAVGGVLLALLGVAIWQTTQDDPEPDVTANGERDDAGKADEAEGSQPDPDEGPALPNDGSTTTTAAVEPTTGTETDTATTSTTGEAETGTETGEDTDDGPKPVAKHTTPECAKVRSDAEKAVKDFAWDTALKHARNRSCWASKTERVRIEVKALKELKRFEECMKAGKGVSDRGVKDDVAFCEKRFNQG